MSDPKCTPEYNDTTRKLMAEMDALEAQAREVQKSVTRQAQLEKQTAGFRARIAAGDLARPAKRESPTYDEGVTHALLERNRVKQQIDALIDQGDRLNRTPMQKMLGMVTDAQLIGVLATHTVYEHLAGAVGAGHIMSALADVTRSGARHIPGLKKVFAQSPQYGLGVNAKAYAGRLRGARAVPREMKRTLLTGQAAHEQVYGKQASVSNEYMTMASSLSDALHQPKWIDKIAETLHTTTAGVGRTHAAVKVALTVPEFHEAQVRETLFIAKQLKAQGMSEADATAYINSELVQTAIGTRAAARAYGSKLQGNNVVNQAVDRGLGALSRSTNAGANALGAGVKVVDPVRKIGIEMVGQGTELGIGVPKAMMALLRKSDMTPERADYIAKNIGQQGAGAIFLATGVLLYHHFGGVPGVFNKKDQAKKKDSLGNPIEPGGSDFVDKAAFHGASQSMVQIGASMAQVYHAEYGKKKGLDLALDVVGKPTLSWLIRSIPYTDTLRRMQNTAEYGRGRKDGIVGAVGENVGNVARSIVVPSEVQKLASAQDKYKGYRRPKNIVDDLKMGIPGLREQVPKK